MGLVPPADGFLAGLRKRCTRTGALLVFDEVITGFRVGVGGAQERFAITPDLSIFGKVVGGGLPLAAVGGPGRADGRARAARPRVPGGHALGEPARDRGRARGARQLDADSVRRRSSGSPARLAAGLDDAFTDAGVAAQVDAGVHARRRVLRAARRSRTTTNARRADH